VSCAKTAELIEMPFGMPTRVDPKNHVSDDSPDIHTRRDNFEGEKGPAYVRIQ